MPTSSTALTIFCLLTSTLPAFFTSGCTSEHEQKQPVQNTSTSTITVGADRLFTEYSHLIDGKRLALVTNHSGRLSNGTHLADALFEYPDADLVVLFGMEFNVRSNDYSLPRDAESDTDPVTGLPKHSLYGSTHKPTGEMLEGVEVIVFDIQEVGARFYEHINILGFVMEAAAENDIEIIVLDRPNPITGNHMDGFITDDEFLYGFGAFGKVPVIHGMTMAELALLYNGERMLRGGHQATLHVIEMQGWDRSMWYDETGIEWSRPSPNLPTLESILAYAGTCLFEGLNISEGRGTEKPFEYIGAPWIDHHAVAGLLNGLELPGVTFETIEFTPERMPFHGRDPYLAGERSNGIYVNVTDRDVFEPYKAGVAMVWAIHELHADHLEWNERTWDRLTGTRRLMNMLREGSHPTEIFAAWEDELEAFRRTRDPYLLY
ncbi:MAG: DUF1343 domain-containing protein [Rhodothermaceae bacterium]|nr:DUF1343 domain-containing protein [Rhodothermaceae bacterium]